ncbi:hypothetical protein MIMGU_mgv1a015610mg [Erythranthe guttata]|uniref:Uncharacterized protein n=1 Tax=Erythranthe guttata TaxID=4155 RepID=A0A022QK11_ERYGU|nr:hypothetical protein MIMGU_mgv1a015610mg [Erythranthe guttata]
MLAYRISVRFYRFNIPKLTFGELFSLRAVINTATKSRVWQAMRQVRAKVNFSYFEAGENKQALVKLVACERCAEKLYYKKQKEKEQLKRKEDEKQRRKRDRSESDDDKVIDYGGSKERRKGKKGSTSASDLKLDDDDDDDDNFDEYLQGMFP